MIIRCCSLLIAGLFLGTVSVSATPQSAAEPVGGPPKTDGAAKPTSFLVTEEMLFMDDPAKWATPRVILPPEYPPAQLEAKAEGYVDVEVKLDKFGMVQSIVSMKSAPPNPEFESAVRAVVQKWWAFHETLSPDCALLEATGNVRVWFSIREGKGVVSVSGEATEATKEFSRKQKKAKVLNLDEVVRAIRYPNAARRDGIEGNVYAYVQVEAKTGVPIAAKISSVIANGGTGHYFVNTVQASLNMTRFEPVDGPNYRVCRSVNFRLTD